MPGTSNLETSKLQKINFHFCPSHSPEFPEPSQITLHNRVLNASKAQCLGTELRAKDHSHQGLESQISNCFCKEGLLSQKLTYDLHVGRLQADRLTSHKLGEVQTSFPFSLLAG